MLHIDGCPNWEEAGILARRALDATGLSEVPVEFVLIRTQREAMLAGFAGSPTIVVAGEDLFATHESTADLACRVYVTEHGLAGVPTQDQIEHALQTHRSRIEGGATGTPRT